MSETRGEFVAISDALKKGFGGFAVIDARHVGVGHLAPNEISLDHRRVEKGEDIFEVAVDQIRKQNGAI